MKRLVVSLCLHIFVALLCKYHFLLQQVAEILCELGAKEGVKRRFANEKVGQLCD